MASRTFYRGSTTPRTRRTSTSDGGGATPSPRDVRTDPLSKSYVGDISKGSLAYSARASAGWTGETKTGQMVAETPSMVPVEQRPTDDMVEKRATVTTPTMVRGGAPRTTRLITPAREPDYKISGKDVTRKEYLQSKGEARARAYRSGGYQIPTDKIVTEVSILKKKTGQPYTYKGKGYSSKEELQRQISRDITKKVFKQRGMDVPKPRISGEVVTYQQLDIAKGVSIKQATTKWQQQKVFRTEPQIIVEPKKTYPPIPPSEIREYTPPKGFIEGSMYRLGVLSFKTRRELQEDKGPLTFAKTFGIQLGIGLGRAGIGTLSFIRHPYETTKETAKLFAKPKELGVSLGKAIKERPVEVFGEAFGFYLIGKGLTKGFKQFPKITQELPFVPKPKQIRPSKLPPKVVKSAEMTSRQRATVMLKDIEGKYLMGETKGGRVISIGGGVERGQTVRKAALAELKQETGLTIKDVKGFKFETKVVTPEETFHIFTGRLKPESIKRIRAASDVQAIRFIEPKMAKGFTGPSFRYPVAKRGVRSYELGLINLLETGQEPTWLVAGTRGIKGPAETILRKGRLVTFERVGKPSIKKPYTIFDYFKGRDPGTFKKFGDIWYLGTQSRYDVPFKFLKPVAESRQPLLFAHATPYSRLGMFSDWMRRRVKLKEKKVKRGKEKGVSLFVQPPSGTLKGSPGYLGVSYLGLDTVSESLGLKVGWKRPTALIMEEVPSPKYFKLTKKGLRGKEFELALKEGPVLQTPMVLGEARREVKYFGGKKVFFQPVEIVKGVKAEEVLKLTREFKKKGIPISKRKALAKELKKRTGIEYGDYKYISPLEGVKPAYYTKKFISYRPSLYAEPSYKLPYYRTPYKGGPYVAGIGEVGISYGVTKPYTSPYGFYGPKYKGVTYRQPYVSPKYGVPKVPVYYGEQAYRLRGAYFRPTLISGAKGFQPMSFKPRPSPWMPRIGVKPRYTPTLAGMELAPIMRGPPPGVTEVTGFFIRPIYVGKGGVQPLFGGVPSLTGKVRSSRRTTAKKKKKKRRVK